MCDCGNSEFLVFEFELSEPLGPLEEEAERLSNAVAQFRVFVGEDLLYRDLDFPIVELALVLAEWCDEVEETGRPFAFASDARSRMLPPLLRISRGAQGWHLASIQRELPSARALPLQRILTEARRFIADVDAAVFDAFGFRPLALRR